MQRSFFPRIVAGGVVGAAGVFAMFPACTDSYRPAHGNGGGTTTGSTTNGTGGGVTLHDSGMCPITCSNDLKNVVDCNGVVQMACSADQGCVNGMCIADPCMAAEVSKSSYGCDYWALKTVQQDKADGACFVAFVANTWEKAVHLTVERAGAGTLDPSLFVAIPQGQGQSLTYQPYDKTMGIPVGEVAILFLSRQPAGGSAVAACPVAPAVAAETGISFNDTGDGNGIGTAFHITSDYPVVAYQMTPYGGAQAYVTSATLLLPTSAWDTNYVAVNAYQAAGAQAKQGLPSLNVVAYQDNTQVTINPVAGIVGGAGNPSLGIGPVPGTPAHVPVTYTLNTGQFLQITQSAELTGSAIQSSQPVGVWGAHACMFVPVTQSDCDSAQQQIPPVKALGSEYVGVRYRGRGGGQDESVPWRLVGAVDGTTLTWLPSAPPGAPTTLDQGQVAEINTPGPFVVSSQGMDHPFYLGGYMTGGGLPPSTGPFDGEGDPDWVNVITPPQYLNHYVLFTDPTYPETTLTLVRTPSKVDGTFADVTLSCAGATMPMTVPSASWTKIGKYEYARVDLSTGNFMNVNGCSNGRQELMSNLPFGVTVWGWGNTTQTLNVSYAYPAGAGFQPINMVVVPTTK